jgi:hypothetical protein
MNRAKHMTDMGRLSQVACYFPSFVDVRGRRTRCDFLDLASVVCDFHSDETSVWMFCGLRNAMKNYVVISWPYT